MRQMFYLVSRRHSEADITSTWDREPPNFSSETAFRSCCACGSSKRRNVHEGPSGRRAAGHCLRPGCGSRVDGRHGQTCRLEV
jgi:hypothetical protein